MPGGSAEDAAPTSCWPFAKVTARFACCFVVDSGLVDASCLVALGSTVESTVLVSFSCRGAEVEVSPATLVGVIFALFLVLDALRWPPRRRLLDRLPTGFFEDSLPS